MNKKKFVLDTSVLLHAPDCIFKFEDNEAVIPITSLIELDTFKKDQREIGRNARHVTRTLKELMLSGNIREGVVVNNKGGTLRVSLPSTEEWMLQDFDPNLNDHKILNCAAYYDGILVSNDINLRIKAEACGVKSEDYLNDKIDVDELYDGVRHIDIKQTLVDKVYDIGKLDLGEIDIEDPIPNECFVLHADSNSKQSALVRYNSVMKEYVLLPQDMKTFDLLPRNLEQTFLLDILKDESIKLISVTGKAGTGKGMCILAAALHLTYELGLYKKILLLKPIVPMDGSN